jgi:hypothetical protein
MPPPDVDTYTSVKHFLMVAIAGAAPVNLLADNPQRNYLYVRNSGVNAGAFWFDQAKDTGQSIVLGPGASHEFHTKVPINRAFFQSVLGTQFGVIEGYTKVGGR